LRVTFFYGVIGEHISILPKDALRLRQQLDTWSRSAVGARNQHFQSVNADWEHNGAL
jgi:hypothetical protein